MGFPVKTFDEFYELPFNKFANTKIPSYWRPLKRKLSKILHGYQPDLVHAHNIVAAKLISEFRVPFIYNDHEYWSKYCRLQARIWKPNKMFIKWLWTRWEKEVLRKASAVITTTETIAREHRTLCNHVYVAPNFPSRVETESLKLSFNEYKHLSSVYIGSDFSRSLAHTALPHRNTEDVLQIFRHDGVGTLTVFGDTNLPSFRNINSLGFLPHHTMMKKLTKHHIGLIPWKKHWLHKYNCPNKAYEYAHAGLLVLTVSDLIDVRQHLGKYCVTFDDPNELEELLLYYAANLDEIDELRPQIRKFALENLTWEKKCAPAILRAYSKI